MDILFLDEAGQGSAGLNSIMDNILQKLHKSNMQFGDALVLGTMDHAQLQPINAFYFLFYANPYYIYNGWIETRNPDHQSMKKKKDVL